MYCLDFSWIRVYAGTAVLIAKEHNAISFDVAFVWVEHNTSFLYSCHQCMKVSVVVCLIFSNNCNHAMSSAIEITPLSPFKVFYP